MAALRLLLALTGLLRGCEALARGPAPARAAVSMGADDTSTRRSVVSAMVAAPAAGAFAPPARARPGAPPAASETAAELREMLVGRAARPSAGPSSAEVDGLLDAYVSRNPPLEPAARARGALAAGAWRVVHAPHIERLAGLLGAAFDVTYTLDERQAITSHVRYSGGLCGRGFLSTRGSWKALDPETVSVAWDEIWWSPGAERPKPAEEGALAGLVQAVGKAGMVESVSAFPVELLAPGLCSFRFRATDSRIVAVRVEGDLW